ncbi:hypothetical protein AGRA3207_001544 [Actinomadura graeca]|uniref:DUF6879 domain-containing protein n=1 Tax=Actinomadura graeca TaxID=2750812 RepID=A0ABX8QPQ0_9ACTN|nr:DUF6879 family protein [Actinomadura graeca]QXJ20774.1 hypothetical protein AGRA3207_001544 [Actinomadura graeca]
MRDTYNVESERVPLARWREGERDDFAWLEGWLDFIRGIARSGVQVQRLRVVSEPHTEYTRWSIEVTRLNVAAGEDVRYLPRQHAEDILLPDEDCWLVDEDGLILSLFEPDGGSAGFAVEPDPRLTAHYRSVRDRAWPRGIPYSDYAGR